MAIIVFAACFIVVVLACLVIVLAAACLIVVVAACLAFAVFVTLVRRFAVIIPSYWHIVLVYILGNRSQKRESKHTQQFLQTALGMPRKHNALCVSRIWKIRDFLRDDLLRTDRCEHIWRLVIWALVFEFPATHRARVFDLQALEQTRQMEHVTAGGARDIRVPSID